MQVSEKTRRWLEESGRRVGAVVHTLDQGKPVRAELTADGWVFESEPWQYSLS